MESGWRLAFAAAWLLILWSLELRYPLRENNRSHTLTNVVLTISLIVINFLMTIVAYQVSLLCDRYNFGIFQWLTITPFLSIVIAVLFLDFWAAYLSHRLMHKFSWLWQFHEIHHSDTMVDVTTAFRQHPVESVYRILFQIAGLALLGAPLYMLVIYQTFSALYAQLEHSNIRLNSTVDKFSSMIFVTPNFHKIHHSADRPYTDSNFGNIFSIWDRLFRTYRMVKNLKHLRYGLDYFRTPEKGNDLIKLFLRPFHWFRKTL